MNVLRRIAMGIGGTVVAALVIGLAAPKTVHALVWRSLQWQIRRQIRCR